MLQVSGFLGHLRGSSLDVSEADALSSDPVRLALRDVWSIEAGEGDRWVRMSGPAPEAVAKRAQVHVAGLDRSMGSHRYSDTRGRFNAQVSESMWEGLGDPDVNYVFAKVPLTKPASRASTVDANKVKANAVSVMREQLDNPALLSALSSVANPRALLGIVEQFNREDTPIRSLDGKPLAITGQDVRYRIEIQPLPRGEALVKCELAFMNGQLQAIAEGSSEREEAVSRGYATFKFDIKVSQAAPAELMTGSLSYLYRLSSWPAPFPEPLHVGWIVGPNANPQLKAEFRAYVERQLVPYNLEFLESLQALEGTPELSRLAAITALVGKFFNQDNELNLSNDLRVGVNQAHRALQNHAADGHRHLIEKLNAAQAECVTMMTTNELPRFRRAVKEGTYLLPPGR
jgi:hypothetical protein